MSDEMIFDLTESQLRTASVIQRLVYRCIRMTLNEAGEKDREKFPGVIELLRVWCDHFVRAKEIHKAEVVFDETIWPPSQPERHGAVVQVYVDFDASASHYIVEIDLTKGYFDCASLRSPMYGVMPINPFHVRFQAGADTPGATT